MIREYYRLTKPGMVYGNALIALAAFVFASHGAVDLPLLAATLSGLSLAIAGACVINNVIDQDIDAKMERTKERAVPSGRIQSAHALSFGLILLAVAFGTLLRFDTLLATLAVLFGVIVYIAGYTPLKRRSLHSTIVGALAGAAPPVVGYVAVTHSLDTVALCLFLILVAWQMTHFFAIGIYRLLDYRAASIPIMPAVIGTQATKAAMLSYALVFALANYAFVLVARPSVLYSLVMAPLSLGWIALTIAGFRARDEREWARGVFFYSLLLLVAFALALTCSGRA